MKASAAKARYANDGKDIARRLVAHWAAVNKVESMLELGGAGDSARLHRELLPEVSLVVAEQDQELWPLLRVEAQQFGYALVTGDFREARGIYDAIWLDLCSQWCPTTREAVIDASRMLTKEGILAVTVLGAREVPEIAVDRWAILPFLVSQAAGKGVEGIYRYRSGSPMWLFFLSGRYGASWNDFGGAEHSMAERGWVPFDYASPTWTETILKSLGRPVPEGTKQALRRERRALARALTAAV